MIFATLAIGAGCAAPDEPRPPIPTTSTAACPCAGHGSCGGVPGIVYRSGSVRVTTGSGSGWDSRIPPTIATLPSRITTAASDQSHQRRRRRDGTGTGAAVVGVAVSMACLG
jgi:hypothetical protein